jgi:hypothetical protein
MADPALREHVVKANDPKPTAPGLAKAIATHLPGWRFVVDEDGTRDHFAALERDDGAGLHLFVRTYGTPHLEITGRPPRYRDGRRYSPHRWTRIGCSPTRDPAAIARDIARRLLPKYLIEYAKAVQFVAETEAGEDAAIATAGHLAAILGCASGSLQKGCVQVRLPVREDGAYGHFEVRAGMPPTIGLILHGVPLAQAEPIARVLADRTEGAP